MNKLYATIGIVGAVVVGYLIFSGEEAYKSSLSPTPAFKPLPSPVVRVDNFKEGFMEGCTEDAPELYDYCNCTYNYFDLTMEKSEMMRFGLEIESNPDLPLSEYPQEMKDAVIFCADKI